MCLYDVVYHVTLPGLYYFSLDNSKFFTAHLIEMKHNNQLLRYKLCAKALLLGLDLH